MWLMCFNFMVQGTSGQQSAQPKKGGQVVLLGTLDRGATTETPLDGVLGMDNPRL